MSIVQREAWGFLSDQEKIARLEAQNARLREGLECVAAELGWRPQADIKCMVRTILADTGK